jgi:hypothetical protein
MDIKKYKIDKIYLFILSMLCSFALINAINKILHIINTNHCETWWCNWLIAIPWAILDYSLLILISILTLILTIILIPSIKNYFNNKDEKENNIFDIFGINIVILSLILIFLTNL